MVGSSSKRDEAEEQARQQAAAQAAEYQRTLATQTAQRNEALRLQKEQEDKLTQQREEQAKAIEQQRIANEEALERQRKEEAFKLAVDAMNERSMLPKTKLEDVGVVDITEEERKKRGKQSVGYDKTKVTGLLGEAPVQRNQLLGV